MDFPAHALAKGTIDHLVALQGTLAGKRRADDDGFVVHVILAAHAHGATGQMGLDQRLDFGRFHDGAHYISIGRSAAGPGCALRRI